MTEPSNTSEKNGDSEYREPEFHLQKLDLSLTIADPTTLPARIRDWAFLKNFHQRDQVYRKYFPDYYSFELFMQNMYETAVRDQTVKYYDMENGERRAEFPVLLPPNKKYSLALFTQNKKEHLQTPFFFVGFSDRGNIPYCTTNLLPRVRNHLKQSNSEDITDGNKLGKLIEISFKTSIQQNNIIQYQSKNESFVEFPLSELPDSKKLISLRFRKSETGWIFQDILTNKLRGEQEFSDILHSRLHASWIKDEQKKDAARQREIQKREEITRKKIVKKEEPKQELIPLEPFTVRRENPSGEEDYLGRLQKFANINKNYPPYLKYQDIVLEDTEENLNRIAAAFSACNPYTGIQYYCENNTKTAELKVNFPEYPGVPIYAEFTENTSYNKTQKWFLHRLVWGEKYHRIVYTDNRRLWGSIQQITEPEEIGISGVETLLERVAKSFAEALQNEQVFCYGIGEYKMAEFPANLKNTDGQEIHAVLSLHPIGKWQFSCFKIRSGNIHEQITREYLELTNQRRNEGHTDISSEGGVTEKQETIESRYIGEMIPDSNGNPIHLWGEFAVPMAAVSKDVMEELVYMAEPEIWEFTPEKPYEILFEYLDQQFIRLGYEKKIAYHHCPENPTEEYVAFHTGLFTRYFREPIYACFRYNYPKWRLDGLNAFCCKTSGGTAYDRMQLLFPHLPENTDFLRDENGQYLPLTHYKLDIRIPITLQKNHIILERGYRFPHPFLEKTFRYSKDRTALSYLEEMKNNPQEAKRIWAQKLLPHLEAEENTDTYNHLFQQLQYVVDEGKYSTTTPPIPMYYSLENSITWLLPLNFSQNYSPKNLALIIAVKENGEYEGRTILPIEDLYAKARVVENPNRSWINNLTNHANDEPDEEGIDDYINT